MGVDAWWAATGYPLRYLDFPGIVPNSRYLLTFSGSTMFVLYPSPLPLLFISQIVEFCLNTNNEVVTLHGRATERLVSKIWHTTCMQGGHA